MALQAALKSPDFELSHWISSLELDPLLSKSDSVSKILSELEHIAARLQTELDLGLDQASKDVVKLSHRVQGLDSNLITAQGKLDEICSTVVVENHQVFERLAGYDREIAELDQLRACLTVFVFNLGCRKLELDHQRDGRTIGC